MKLLQPRQLNDELQRQSSEQMKAGLFLARKVDALREEVQDVQKNHDETIEKLKKEFALFSTEHESKKGILLNQIRDAEEKLADLRKPLDTEWEKINELSKENTKKHQFLEGLGIVINDRERSVERREKNVETSENKVKDILSEAKQIKEKAQKDYQEAQDILINAKENEKQTKKDLKIRTEAVEKRETDIAYREIDVENRIKNVLAKEEENRKETLRIESKQKQLAIAYAEIISQK